MHDDAVFADELRKSYTFQPSNTRFKEKANVDMEERC